MYFNYKNISQDIKISLMAMEGFVSMNRLKNLYTPELNIEIIYNKRFVLDKECEKTEEILRLEKVINSIVTYKLENNSSVEEINSFLNKVSAGNIEKIVKN